MGELVIKASRAHEWYAIWSTYNDCIVRVYPTRAEALEYVSRPITQPDGSINTQPLTGIFTPESRVQRADEHGSSSLQRKYGWETSWLLFSHDTPPRPNIGAWLLPRNRLLDYCKLLYIGSDKEAMELFVFFSETEDGTYP